MAHLRSACPTQLDAEFQDVPRCGMPKTTKALQTRSSRHQSATCFPDKHCRSFVRRTVARALLNAGENEVDGPSLFAESFFKAGRFVENRTWLDAFR